MCIENFKDYIDRQKICSEYGYCILDQHEIAIAHI